MSTRLWTDDEFERMSWHDNHVHALRILEGRYGSGRLLLDVDYILEWHCDAEEHRFLVQPVTLTFFDVSALRLTLDYASPSAALAPFSIDAIERRLEERERYTARLWTILISWPPGEITFEAAGYEQRAIGRAVPSREQCLRPDERVTDPS